MDINNFLLVTGLPRSGTTPVGELLTLDWRSFYIYEPMNFDSGDECIPEYLQFQVTGLSMSRRWMIFSVASRI